MPKDKKPARAALVLAHAPADLAPVGTRAVGRGKITGSQGLGFYPFLAKDRLRGAGFFFGRWLRAVARSGMGG